MGNELITRDQLQSDLETLYNNKISPYLNGATHTGFTPVGTIISYFGETAPVHYLICDGATYNKSDYPELWTHLSSLTDTTPYVVDGDNTKFKVPDLRGEFLRGTGTNGHTDQGSGAGVGVHQDATRFPDFYVYDGSSTTIGVTSIAGDSGRRINDVDSALTGTGSNRYVNANSTTTNEGKNITTRPTNTSVLFCIAYKDIYIDYAIDGFPVAVTNPQDKQGLTFDAATQKWVNGAGGLHEYSTTEKVVGTWIDGRPIYEKVLTVTKSSWQSTNSGANIIADMDDYDINQLISIKGYLNCSDGNTAIIPRSLASTVILDWGLSPNNELQFFCGSYYSDKTNTVICIVQYTKSTDTPAVQS